MKNSLKLRNFNGMKIKNYKWICENCGYSTPEFCPNCGSLYGLPHTK